MAGLLTYFTQPQYLLMLGTAVVLAAVFFGEWRASRRRRRQSQSETR